MIRFLAPHDELATPRFKRSCRNRETFISELNDIEPKSAASRRLARLLSPTLVICCAPVWCEPAQPPDSLEQIPDIIVTAQKHEERAQDIPMSLTVLSAEDITRNGAHDFNDLLLDVPGVSYADSRLGLSNFSIRGISTTAANPTVGVYFDDISLITVATAFAGAMQPMPVDLDRIEILKGPQGTLYGGSAMGGAIKYVSKKPVLNDFSISFGGEGASVDHGGDTYGGESFINLPLSEDRLALRLGGAYRFDAGYVDNVRNGEVQVWTESASPSSAPFQPISFSSRSQFAQNNYNSRSTTVERASVLYQPLESFSVLPVATIQRTDQPNPDEFFTNLPDYQNSNRFSQPEHDDFNIYSLELTGVLPAVTLTSLSGYVDRRIDFIGDFSLFVGMLTPALLSNNSYNFSSTSTNTLSQEVRASSGSAGSPFNWTVGLYFSRQHDYYAQAIDTIGAGMFYADGTDIIFGTDTLTRTRQEAVFGDIAYAPGSNWSFAAGLRWFDIRQRIDGGGNGIDNGGLTVVSDRQGTNAGITPRFSVSYHFSDNHMLYANAAKGFRPGGPNALGTNSPECAPSLAQLGLQQTPGSYQSDSLWSYEVGAKNQFPGIPGMLNVALFYSDWKKIQQSITLASCALSYVGNVGAARVEGAELTAEFPVLRDIRIGGTIAYTQTKVTQSAGGVDAQVGEELLDTPKSMDSVYGEYRVAIEGNAFVGMRMEYDYHGANLRQFSPFQAVTYSNGTTGEIPDATQIQAAYHVVNTSAFFSKGKLVYRLFVDNALDADPYLNFRRVPGFSGATTLRPRTIGIRVKASF